MSDLLASMRPVDWAIIAINISIILLGLASIYLAKTIRRISRD